jgi:2-polyprenyl-3-methyl-5-hydroxy-6-metoxy-1,4-benzoquinol methylase
MKIGPAIRRLMPFSVERRAAQLYRIVFVDLDKVAACLINAIPPSARVLDIGGGDGELLNCLLARRPDLHVTMVDISSSVGRFLQPQYRDRVRFCPNTPIDKHLSEAARHYDAAIISDVMHHIPIPLRTAFVRDVHQALKPGAPMFVKDIEPGHRIATLSLYADKYVSGDKNVSLVSMREMTDLTASILPVHHALELGLLECNAPNYMMQFCFEPMP